MNTLWSSVILHKFLQFIDLFVLSLSRIYSHLLLGMTIYSLLKIKFVPTKFWKPYPALPVPTVHCIWVSWMSPPNGVGARLYCKSFTISGILQILHSLCIYVCAFTELEVIDQSITCWWELVRILVGENVELYKDLLTLSFIRNQGSAPCMKRAICCCVHLRTFLIQRFIALWSSCLPPHPAS